MKKSSIIIFLLCAAFASLAQTRPRANQIRFTPAGTVSATDVQSAIEEVATEAGGGTVTSVSGTADRITSTGGTTPVIDIAATYVGQSSITTTGTLTSGSTGTGFTVALGTSTITGSLPVANLTAKYIIDQATASTAGATITLDCNSQIQRSFLGSATFATAKDIALSNTTNAMFFNFIFEVTNVAAVLTVPSDWLMSVDNFDGIDWTPPATGKYEIGGSFDDTANVWYVKIAGPFN